MERIQLFGARLHERWRRLNFTESSFPELAAEELDSAALHQEITLLDVVKWATTRSLPTQVDAEFGNPITVFHNPYFYIDVLTWIDGTTSIHEHTFAGAFAVLSGSSVHCRYQFLEIEALSDRLRLGQVSCLGVEHLKAGDVRRIHQGAAGAHSLFHLDRPTLSLVVRTHIASVATPQYLYLPPSVAFDPHFTTPYHRVGIRVLDTIRAVGGDQLLDTAVRMISDTDVFSAFRYVYHLCQHLPSNEACHMLLDRIADVQPGLVSHLRVAIDELRRRQQITRLRREQKGTEDRYMLALLANVREREAILRLIRGRYPDLDPTEKLVQWACGLLGVSLEGSSLEESLIRGLVSGSNTLHLAEQLAVKWNVEGGVSSVSAFIEELQDSVLSSVIAT